MILRVKFGRRYALSGVEALQNASPADQAKLAHELRAAMYAPDGRLKS